MLKSDKFNALVTGIAKEKKNYKGWRDGMELGTGRGEFKKK